MPLISMFPCSAGGASIDYNSRPQIDFDGKWIKWFVEFYDGEPYWEAWFFSSGTLTVTGTYTADAWGIGGGACLVGSGADNLTGRGNTATVLGVTLSSTAYVDIGIGARTWNTGGGDTKLGEWLTATGGVVGLAGNGLPYRFGDPDKANEAGANGTSGAMTRAGGGFLALGAGGWLYWRAGETSAPTYNGEGYGASAGTNGSSVSACAHDGALVIRIKI